MSPGFKHFFTPELRLSARLRLRGLGVHERMPPWIIRRPHGSGDWLLMVFHDPAFIATGPELGELQPAQTLMLWPPGTGQFYGRQTHPFSHSWLHCSGDLVRELVVSSRLPVGRPCTLAEEGACTDGLLAMHQELTRFRPPDAVIVGNLLENLLRHANRLRQGAAPLPTVAPGLAAARQAIASAHRRALTLADLAAIAGLSPAHFSSRFRRAYGLSPIQCLIQHRLDHAAYLLKDPHLPVAEIARRVGFGDPFHFSRSFRRRFGCSPQGLRRQRLPHPS